MVQYHRIAPNAAYTNDGVVDVLGFTTEVLARARRRGELKFAKKGPVILYLGRWVLDWLELLGREEEEEELLEHNRFLRLAV